MEKKFRFPQPSVTIWPRRWQRGMYTQPMTCLEWVKEAQRVEADFIKARDTLIKESAK